MRAYALSDFCILFVHQLIDSKIRDPVRSFENMIYEYESDHFLLQMPLLVFMLPVPCTHKQSECSAGASARFGKDRSTKVLCNIFSYKQRDFNHPVILTWKTCRSC